MCIRDSSGTAQLQSGSDPLLELFAPLRRQASPMERYCGYYFEYSNCMSVPGHVLLSLIHLREERGNYLFERQERQERQEPTRGGSEDWVRCRYLGTAFFLQDRLFLVDYESLTGNEMSQTILIPVSYTHLDVYKRQAPISTPIRVPGTSGLSSSGLSPPRL